MLEVPDPVMAHIECLKHVMTRFADFLNGKSQRNLNNDHKLILFLLSKQKSKKTEFLVIFKLDDFCVKFQLCDTYPRCLYVPSSASSQMLIGSSSFRSKGRLPVLSYLHKNKAAICRCSQPLSGFSARCLEDEQMLNSILRTNPNSTYMYVVDTRPRVSTWVLSFI